MLVEIERFVNWVRRRSPGARTGYPLLSTGTPLGTGARANVEDTYPLTMKVGL